MCGCSRKAYSLDSTPEEVGWGKPLPPTPHLAAPAAAEAVSHGPVPFQTPGFSVSPLGFPDDSVVKNPPAIYIGDAGDTGVFPGHWASISPDGPKLDPVWPENQVSFVDIFTWVLDFCCPELLPLFCLLGS